MGHRVCRPHPLHLAATAAALLLLPSAAVAFRPPDPAGDLHGRAFTAPELRFGVEHQRLADAPQAVPRADAWNAFLLRYGHEIEVFVDTRHIMVFDAEGRSAAQRGKLAA